MSLMLVESFPHCNAKCEKLQSLGTGPGEVKTNSSFSKCSWVPRLRGKVLPEEYCLVCKMPLLSLPPTQETQGMAPGVGQQQYPTSLPIEAGPWGHPSLFLGADGFFVSGKEQFCYFSWFWGNFPLGTNKPGTWNSHGLTALGGRRWWFLEWKSFPVSYLTIHKDFWFMPNSTLLTLPKATLSPGHTP